jgi:hypothetical protein
MAICPIPGFEGQKSSVYAIKAFVSTRELNPYFRLMAPIFGAIFVGGRAAISVDVTNLRHFGRVRYLPD